MLPIRGFLGYGFVELGKWEANTKNFRPRSAQSVDRLMLCLLKQKMG